MTWCITRISSFSKYSTVIHFHQSVTDKFAYYQSHIETSFILDMVLQVKVNVLILDMSDIVNINILDRSEIRCPIAAASAILTDQWSVIVLRTSLSLNAERFGI